MSSSTVINTNVRALNSNRNLRAVGSRQDKASRRLSSGKKVNTAADDAAGLAISEKMKAQIRGLDMASKNAQDATSFAETLEGYISEIDNMFQRIRELSVQSATDSNVEEDRQKMDTEVTDLKAEINEMSQRAEFNTMHLCADIDAGTADADGNYDGVLNFHIGANSNQTITFTLEDMTLEGNETFSSVSVMDSDGAEQEGFENLSIATREGAEAAIDACDSALKVITTYRAKIGALQNRLEYTNNALETASENLSNANSRIVDADMAKEMTNMTSANVINQAAVSMLAQANQAPQTVLQLLS